MKLNTPNKLTLLRILLVPIFMAVLLLESVMPDSYILTRFIAGIIFLLASITDCIDGNMARKHNLITNFGKFLDPLADKMLVSAALICFVALRIMEIGTVITVIILTREFMVTSLRLVANTGDGTVIAASNLGKIKTVLQMIAICTFLFQDAVGFVLGFPLAVGEITLGDVIMWAAVVMTIASGVSYMKTYAKYINTND